MSSNKAAKEELIRRYGKTCFIDRLCLRPKTAEEMQGVKYTGKGQYKKMKQLTYHHIKMRSQGGKATVENGALLSAENHAWFHKQPKADQERMNQQFQELKRKIDSHEACTLELAPESEIELPVELHIATGTFELDAKFEPHFKPKKAVKKKYNRAKQKKKNNRIIKRDYKER